MTSVLEQKQLQNQQGIPQQEQVQQGQQQQDFNELKIWPTRGIVSSINVVLCCYQCIRTSNIIIALHLMPFYLLIEFIDYKRSKNPRCQMYFFFIEWLNGE